jgi:CheY-like chemotaxis protein
MRKVLVHSNNTSFNRPEIFPVSEQFVFEYDYEEDLDSFIDKLLRDGTLGQMIRHTDVLFIKVALSNNYLEYLGIRLAYHVRLTKSLGDKSRIPIVLIAEESLQFLGMTCHEPSILFTNGIYIIHESIKDYLRILSWHADDLLRPLPSLDEFTNSIRIDPPSNYQSHHSIANEWALVRYFNMFQKDESDPKYVNLGRKIECLEYLKTLHFKYMEARQIRQGINHKKNNQAYTPKIRNIEGRRIGIIDDESAKGWSEFYDYLLGVSKGIAVPFLDFHRYEDRGKLLERIKGWIDGLVFSDDPIDLFIVDLRLHDDDFSEQDFDNLSGLEVLRHIQRINRGIQVVVSTASNKVWNFQRCMELGVSHFAVKESPETYSSREETKISLRHFAAQIEAASDRAFLADLYRILERLKRENIFNGLDGDREKEFAENVFGKSGFIDKIFGLLLLDSKSESVLNQCMLLAFQVLENYCDLELVGSFGTDSHKKISSGFVWLKSKERKDIFCSDKDGLLSIFDLKYEKYDAEDPNSVSAPVSFTVFDKMMYSFSRGLKTEATFLVKMITILHFREEVSKIEIEWLMRMRFYRSNVAAHRTGVINEGYPKITVNEIVQFVKIFSEIFIQ